MKTFPARAALAALLLPLPLGLAATPAAAAVDASDPGRFIDTLADEGFGALRGGNKAAARTQFRTLLSQHFAVDALGDRLIRRWSAKITPAQRAAYKAALPNFIIGTYADRLAQYRDADLKVVRTVPAGASAQVMTTVTRPGARPIPATWTVDRVGSGYKVSNLTVGGINLALAQAADFDAVIQRQGFDALIAMMKKRG
ncbi:MlaC/ttg2D family ABC transporter substrate-binding protein [Sphingomonas jatrophae]|uniref:Phospholipid transport system substrate-binding protein n=1 Tax=Sphingomonas jatrophae TaxID=1166337 RepID=A0A1I6JMK3_9SPHN|nr:ABC transporter substrate-binding protein [Sphingomonas jatrophae]SFR80184.1 phospholipid transport system substrate-binding protein [Sphingomonas jatrophae]